MAATADPALSEPIDEAATDAEYRARWQSAIRRERWLWSKPIPCPVCGEWVGHFGGSIERDGCSMIPLNVPLEEVRPNCYAVLRHWIGDAIRAACRS